MKIQNVIFAGAVSCCLILSCRGPEGPVGPQGPRGGNASLTDPAVQPKVIYSYPPANSMGPYADFAQRYNQIQIRFSKIMERGSVRHAFTFSSPNTKVHIDTTSIYSIGDDVWYFYPVDTLGYYYAFRWRVAETYTLGVAGSARDINGNLLQPAYAATMMPEPYFRVTSVYPPPGTSDVQSGRTISLYFNNSVDSSVLSKVQITPALPGHWQYGYGYPGPDSTVLYHTFTPLALNTEYTIRVDSSLRDIDGHQLQGEFVSTFRTAAFLVSSTDPPNGARGVYPQTQIYINLTAGVDTSTIRSAFSITPVLPGTIYAYYPGISYFTFIPQSQMLFDTTYTVSIDTSLRAITGDHLASRYQFSFRTASFAVVSTDPSDGQSFVQRSAYCNVYCNAIVDSSTIRSSFSLKDSTGAAVPGTFGYDVSSYFVFHPNALFLPNAVYTGTISTGLSAVGGKHLKSPFTFSFTTGN